MTDDRTMLGAEPWKQLPAADVVQLHWVDGFVDYEAFFRSLTEKRPIVWTLHDMNAFTGGCHYDGGCGRFAEKCGACPALASRDATDFSRKVWERKRKIFEALPRERLHVVTPSRWLGEEARRSSLFGRFPRSVIPYGLDTEIFQPSGGKERRKALGIPLQAKVILFLADGVDIPRKGYNLALRALEQIPASSEICILTAGRGMVPDNRRFAHVHAGEIADDRLLASTYSAADLLVVPSAQDNLPNTMLESMACGTPVVGFDAGGIPDGVRDGKTGFLAPAGDSAALATAMRTLLDNDALRAEMTANCRRIALEDYAIEIQARRYIELYRELYRQLATASEAARSARAGDDVGEGSANRHPAAEAAITQVTSERQ